MTAYTYRSLFIDGSIYRSPFIHGSCISFSICAGFFSYIQVSCAMGVPCKQFIVVHHAKTFIPKHGTLLYIQVFCRVFHIYRSHTLFVNTHASSAPLEYMRPAYMQVSCRIFVRLCKYIYGVATISKLLKIIGLFCKRAL